MSLWPVRDAKISMFVVDDYYDLCLKLGELKKLQEKREASPNLVYLRLHQGLWMIEDITETIRLGLIGGGMDNKAAYEFVNLHVREGYLYEFATIAKAILGAAVVGVSEDNADEGEPEAPETEPTPSP